MTELARNSPESRQKTMSSLTIAIIEVGGRVLERDSVLCSFTTVSIFMNDIKLHPASISEMDSDTCQQLASVTGFNSSTG